MPATTASSGRSTSPISRRRRSAGIALVSGFADVEIIFYPYPLEDSLVGLVRTEREDLPRASSDPSGASRAGGIFGDGRRTPRRVARALGRLRARRHDASPFSAPGISRRNLSTSIDLADLIECVIDDNPNKQGLRCRGRGLPIVGSAALENGAVDLCLLAAQPGERANVLAKRRRASASGEASSARSSRSARSG